MNVERRSVGRRIGDWFNGLQIRSYLAIKGFDQYHGIKLVNKALSEKGLDKVGKQESDFQIKYFKYHG